MLMHTGLEEEGWMADRKHFMQTKVFPPNLLMEKKIFYRLHNSGYRLLDGVLFKRNFDKILLHYVDRQQVEKILHEFHNGPMGGHFSNQTTIMKIIHVSYYWPSLFKYVHALIQGCKECQFYDGKCKN